MGLINVPPVTNGDANDENLYNSRFATIVNEINGNLNADNLATAAVTTAKVTDKAISGEKMGLIVGFRAFRTAAQSISTGTTTRINFDTESFDYGNNYNHTSGYQFTAPYSGIYSFTASTGLTDVADTRVTQVSINVNDAQASAQRIFSANSVNDPMVSVTAVVRLNQGDLVDARILHDHGSDRNVFTGFGGSVFSGYLIGRI